MEILKINKQVLLLSTMILMLINYINAQNCDHCSSALLQDIVSLDMNKDTYLHFLNIVDRKMYNTAKSKGGFNFSIPIKGVPLGGGYDYDDFIQYRSRIYKQQQFQSETKESYNFISKRTSKRGFKSYDNCINKCHGVPGLYSEVIKSDSLFVTIQIYYQPGKQAQPGPIEPLKINETIIYNGSVANMEAGEILKVGEYISPFQTIRKIIVREDNKILTGVINAGNLGTEFKVNRFQKPDIPKCELKEQSIDACNYIKNLSVNICNNCHGYGNCIITNNSSKIQENKAVYDVIFDCPGRYKIQIYMTSALVRAFQVSFNDKVVNSSSCAVNTGGWHSNTLKWIDVVYVDVVPGVNRLTLYRNDVFPHIRAIRFIPE